MELDLQYFLPIYPEFNKEISDIFGEDVDPSLSNYDIYRKKEFYDYKLKQIENIKSSTAPTYMNHQIIIARFLSSRTLYSGILLMHEPGTGKTCSSVAAIEQIRSETNSFKGALILTKGPAQRDNYLNELVNQCTCYEKIAGKCVYGRYVDKTENEETELDEDMSAKDKKLFEKREQRRIKNNVSDFYQFETFEIFITELSKLSTYEIVQRYSNRIIVIDETHNLRLTDEKSQYNRIHAFLHTIINCKIILLTGTPMRDSPNEIASIMNLILPTSNQLPVEEKFEEEYLVKKGNSMVIKDSMRNVLKSKLHGRISYLKSMRADVVSTYEGEQLLSHFKLYRSSMAPSQYAVYRKAWTRDNESDRQGVYSNSRQASLFVFPNGSYGNEKDGFKRYVKEKKIMQGKRVVRVDTVFNTEIDDSLSKLIKKEWEYDKKIETLKKYSTKYAECIHLLLSERVNHFVYISFVTGSGAILFSKLLELFGFNQSKGQDTQPGLRYAIITNTTSSGKEIKNIFKEFNHPQNMEGKYIRVLIGSKMISESVTLKNVQNIHILTPSWNFGETDQAIARAIRLGSHRDVEEKLAADNGLSSVSELKVKGFQVRVKIYLYCSIGENPEDSIDLYMYKMCEDKDISIKSIEQCIKEASFDCALNKDRNQFVLKDKNGSRSCNYTDCDYSCDGITEEQYERPAIDLSTYHLFYDEDDVMKLVEELKQFFSEKTIVEYEKLVDVLHPVYDEFTIIKAIDHMIVSNIIIADQFGNNCFLRYDHDVLYLTYSLGKSSFLDQYYIEHFSLQQYTDAEEKIEYEYQNYLPKLFDKIRNNPSEAEKRKLIETLPIGAQEILLEMAFLSKQKGVKDVDPIREYIISYFQPYVVQVNETKASVLLYNENEDNTNQLRCLHKNGEEWVECAEQDVLSLKQMAEEKKEELVHNIYGYYGMIEKDKKDKDDPINMIIRDVSDETKIKDTLDDGSKKNGHKKTRGKACKSWNKDDFLKLLYKFKIVPGPDTIENYDEHVSYQEYIKKFSGFTNAQYMQLLERDGFKEVKKAFGKEFETFTNEDKKRMLYWGKQGEEGKKLDKNIICATLKNFFAEKGILL